MDRISYEIHPDFLQALEKDPRVRLAKVEVTALGKTFVEERLYPKGSPSPDKSTFMTNEELVRKFENSASCLLPTNKIDDAVKGLLQLEDVSDFSAMMDVLSI